MLLFHLSAVLGICQYLVTFEIVPFIDFMKYFSHAFNSMAERPSGIDVEFESKSLIVANISSSMILTFRFVSAVEL